MTIKGKWSMMNLRPMILTVPRACCNREIGHLFMPNYQPPQDLLSPLWPGGLG